MDLSDPPTYIELPPSSSPPPHLHPHSPPPYVRLSPPPSPPPDYNTVCSQMGIGPDEYEMSRIS